MTDLFFEALQIVLFWEGGYGDDHRDPGGATNFGITHKTLSDWRKKPITKQDVIDLKMDEVEKIYKALYWIPAHCDKLPDALAIAMFDCAVNQGVDRAKKFLQVSLEVVPDGNFGPRTFAAIDRADEEYLLKEFMVRRVMHYSGLKTLLTFGVGWFRRVFDVFGRCLVRTKFIESRLRNRLINKGE
jgi:lysozyme family protein